MANTELQPDTLLPIREVAERTGVNPVTLRAWERRYGLLVPARTGKGHRLYSELDVQRIEEILTWLARGVAIGQVRPLLQDGREKGVAASEALVNGEPADSWSRLVQETAAAIDNFSAPQLQRQLEQLLSSYPLPLLLDRWLVPLHKVLSSQGRFGCSVTQAFFWQLLIEQLTLIVSASRKNLRRGGTRPHKLLLVGFSGADQQAFALLFCAVLIAAGLEVINLGPDAELGELAFAEDKLKADGVICYSHNALPMAVLGTGLERALRSLKSPLWLAGGFVNLQRRDHDKLIERRHCRRLPAETALALRELREQLQ
ncbi:MerR HTH family regulatory protein [Microbulbifer donghaiensis]|uniref:MerR HTH family regulatory protein n=1 Tax=Microbulbifer donghaiensis TaxID=494016 RepID=A0A1M5CYJ5_9GAMM|nr:MerR family transcriptional regulator [Microbulbifer donghaiensis]SHF59796.1 MerR HTH family regulatory protein [Microbulbifer donghaiensis]